MLMALDSDVCGNRLFTCLSVPPPALRKVTDLLQSNLTVRNSLKDNHKGKGWRNQWSLRGAVACLVAGTMPWLCHSLALAPVWPKPKLVDFTLTAARLEQGCKTARSYASSWWAHSLWWVCFFLHSVEDKKGQMWTHYSRKGSEKSKEKPSTAVVSWKGYRGWMERRVLAWITDTLTKKPQEIAL